MSASTVDVQLKDACIELARHLACPHPDEDPPFGFAELLKRYKVLEVRERMLDADGHLLAAKGSYVIEVNSAVSTVRRRMTIAHEFGHLIINEVRGDNSFAGHSDPKVERLCNDVAVELLCPGEPVRSYFDGERSLGDWRNPICCQTVVEAARRFGVSVDVMARRVFLDLRMAPSQAAVLWRCAENPKAPDSSKALRVASAWHCFGREAFVPLHKRVPNGSVVMKAFLKQGSFCRVEQIDLGSLKGHFEVEAMGYMSFPARSMSQPERAVISLLS
jgi:Zn-dependent peptidase ImmA (M78 family)